MKRTAILAIAAAALTATQAYASGPTAPVVVPAPVYEPVSDWSGFYIGLGAGMGTMGGTAVPPGFNYNGAGLLAGYLYDMGSFVLGGELEIARARTNLFPGLNFNFASAELIAGYDAGNIMPFASVGAARLNQALVLPGGGLNGVSMGVGVNVKATENVMITGKLRYTRYNFPGPATLNTTSVIVGAAYKF